MQISAYAFKPWLIVIGLALTFAITSLFSGSSKEHEVSHRVVRSSARTTSASSSSRSLADYSDHGVFHLVLSFRTHSKRLCRTVTSAMALGYPLPSLLQLDGHRQASLLDDIDMKLEALNGYRAVRDDDLILMMDSDDSWFQLRPQVMLSRYYRQATTSSRTVLLPAEHGGTTSHGDRLARMDAAFGTIGALRILFDQARDMARANPDMDDMHQIISSIAQRGQHGLDIRFDTGIISSADTKLARGAPMQAALGELRHSRPPFWSMMKEDLPRSASWEQRPLRMNSQAGVVPAISMYDSDENETEKQWSKTWFSRSLVPLYRLSRHTPLGPIAFAGNKFWWPHRYSGDEYEVVIKGAKLHMDEDSVCAGTLEDVLSGK